MWLKDPKTGEKSVTVTILVITALTALGKVLIAGTTIAGFKMAVFSGVDFAAMIGAAGSVYGFRKFTDKGDK